MEPKVYIILLNFATWNDTIECLDSLLNLDYSNHTIVVVDNDSPNNSFEHLVAWAERKKIIFNTWMESDLKKDAYSPNNGAKVVFIKSSQNKGFAAGNNVGIRYSTLQNDYDYLWLLNNDTVVDSQSLGNLTLQAERDRSSKSKTGIWGSKLLFYDQPTIIQAIGGKLNLTTFTTSHLHEGEPDGPHQNIDQIAQDYVVGASMFVSKNFVEEVGPLNEDYFLYFEELDWATRAKRLGFELSYVYSSKVYHKEGKTIGSNSVGKSKSALADYHGIRSKILFCKKYYPLRMPQLYASLFASTLLRISRLQFSRAKAVIKLMVTTKPQK